MYPEQQFYTPKGNHTDHSEQFHDKPYASGDDPHKNVVDLYGNPAKRQDYLRDLQRPRFRRPRYLSVLILLVLLLGAGELINGQLSTSNTSTILPAYTIRLTTRNNLQVKNTHGSIHIHQGAVNTIVVTATKHMAGLGNLFDTLEVDYSQNNNINTVQVKGTSAAFLFNSASIDLDIAVPHASDLNVYDASGPVTLEDIDGNITAETGSGDVQVTRLQGPIRIKTGSGNIQANTVSGTEDIQSGSGSITLHNAQPEENSILHTGSGDIHFNGTFATNGNYTVESGSGDIDLAVPSNSALLFMTHTGSGRNIENDFHTDSVGISPQSPVSISTGSGSIHIYKQG